MTTARQARFETLEIAGLSRRFGGFTALDHFDLTVRGGEFIALLGPSGCGKSTALNVLAGLLSPTQGTIHIDGQRIDTVAPEHRDFGMVFQNYALFPHLSVADNVGFGLRLRRVKKAERRSRVERALDLVRLGSQADKHPGQLSGGQQQRVAIARAVVTNPRLVLMDEPLSNLDAKLRLDMRTEIRALHQELALTTVYVTHDQTEALSLADRLVVMRDGVVQQIGTPAEVYERPTNAYVAAFVGYRNALTARALDANTVEVAGIPLRVAGHDTPAGQEAVAMIRPEDLVLTAAAARPEPATNVVPMTVRVCEYQGRMFAVEARTADDVVVHGESATALAPGAEVVATLDPRCVRVYATDSGAAVSATEAELIATGQSA